MTEQLTLKEVLEKAIQKEIEAQRFYTALSGMVHSSAIRDEFQNMVQQEKGHQWVLEQYLRGELKEGGLIGGHVVDYEIVDKLSEPEISPDMDIKAAFHLAASREKSSHEFYISLARLHPEGEIKQLLQELAEQELGHKQRLEFLYTEVAFPQTDGG
ncbi:ferritin family protein [Chloroflexota bacterium]